MLIVHAPYAEKHNLALNVVLIDGDRRERLKFLPSSEKKQTNRNLEKLNICNTVAGILKVGLCEETTGHLVVKLLKIPNVA